MKKQSHWDKHAAQWQLLESPLRPNRQDVAYYEWAARQAHDSSGGERSKALLLGVTPEIASMHWPPETRLLAVDCCKEMVRDVWPLHGQQDALAVCGDWFSLPAFSGKMEFVVGDGCFTLVDYPKGYLKLASSIHAALSKGGRVVLRFFVRPEVREDIKDIALDLENERIGSFHAFKCTVMTWQRVSSSPMSGSAGMISFLKRMRCFVVWVGQSRFWPLLTIIRESERDIPSRLLKRFVCCLINSFGKRIVTSQNMNWLTAARS